MPTPEELRRMADSLEQQGEAFASEMRQAAASLRKAADVAAREALQKREHSGSSRGSMLASPAAKHRSEGKAPTPLIRSATEAGYTLRSLSKTLKVSHVLLSQASRGERSISRDLADRVQKLIGLPADKAHWPKLRE